MEIKLNIGKSNVEMPDKKEVSTQQEKQYDPELPMVTEVWIPSWAISVCCPSCGNEMLDHLEALFGVKLECPECQCEFSVTNSPTIRWI